MTTSNPYLLAEHTYGAAQRMEVGLNDEFRFCPVLSGSQLKRLGDAKHDLAVIMQHAYQASQALVALEEATARSEAVLGRLAAHALLTQWEQHEWPGGSRASAAEHVRVGLSSLYLHFERLCKALGFEPLAPSLEE
ncbi:MAG: hypothetical protein ACRDH2_14240 [Anaerolineales bacterium]